MARRVGAPKRVQRLKFVFGLFRDSTRLKLLRLERGNNNRVRLVFRPRPREPPPPPPPIAQVLKPVVPPKKFNASDNQRSDVFESSSGGDEFSSDEFDEEEDEEEVNGNNGNDNDGNAGSESESGISSEDSNCSSSSHHHQNCDKSDVIVLRPNSPLPDPKSDDNNNNNDVLISSSSWIKVDEEKTPSDVIIKAPPRLKKLAKLQQVEEMRRSKSEKRLEISSPVLLATTFNPNDAEAHKTIDVSLSSIESDFSVSVSGGGSKKSSLHKSLPFKGEFKKLSSMFSSLSPSSSSKDIVSRSSFYVAEAVYEEAMNDDAEDDNEDHIYEEIPESKDPLNDSIENRPLPPIPEALTSTPKRERSRSIFEGASKYEILHYLKDAKERLGPLDEPSFKRNQISRASGFSSSSDSSFEDKISFVAVERNDSGVGSETSSCSAQSSLSRRLARSRMTWAHSLDQAAVSGACSDCRLAHTSSYNSLLCTPCGKQRSERKEIVTEIYETELKYGRDLRIVVEEFYRPMLVAGLLTSDQLAAIFLNAEELIRANACFATMLGDAINNAAQNGDDDLLSVNVGRIFLEAMFMLRAYESYCTRQASASALLAQLEKEKELLKIFLKVSQMENNALRRMNLGSFLMVSEMRRKGEETFHIGSKANICLAAQ